WGTGAAFHSRQHGCDGAQSREWRKPAAAGEIFYYRWKRSEVPRRVTLQIAARRLDQVTIFDITGHIDLANSPELRKVLLKELRETKTPRVILNLTGVRYIDSSR